jgi:hypothetical protein
MPSCSFPPIHTTVIRSLMRGSISRAEATVVRLPPHATNNGSSESSRIASATIASAPAHDAGSVGLGRPSSEPACNGTSPRPVSSNTRAACSSERST